MNKSKIQIMICHGIILILIISGFQMIAFMHLEIDEVSATTNWTQTSNSDFTNGTLDNVEVTPEGDVKLALLSDSINDYFNDMSGLSYRKNIIKGTGSDKIQLKIIIKTIGGSQNDGFGGAHQTTDGGYILGGSTISYGSGSGDVWMVKTNSSGDEQWNRTFDGGPGFSDSGSSRQTSDGGFIIFGTKDFDGSRDVWLIKTDSNGNEQWSKTFGKDGYYVNWGGLQTTDGGYIIAGWFNHTYPWGEGDCFMIKTNSTGDEQWNKTFTGKRADAIYSISQTSDGGYIATGMFCKHMGSNGKVMLFKFDSNGNHTWNRTFGRDRGDRGFRVRETSDGGFIIAAESYVFDASHGDHWLIKTNSTGVEQWNKTFGRPGKIDSASNVQQTSDGGYLASGRTNSYGMGKSDLWLIKTDANGIEQWNRTYGGTDHEGGASFFEMPDGGFQVFGQTYSFGNGEGDIWMFKIDSTGNVNSSGSLVSSNLMEDKIVVSMESFNCLSSIPEYSDIQVQFSQDNISWYNSTGVMDSWDKLYDGFDSIDISDLNWQGPNFYYRMKFSSNDMNSAPSLQYIKLFYSEYSPSGTLKSELFKTNGKVGWKTLSWDATVQNGSSIKFQLRAGDTDLTSKPFVGPDGTSSSYYTTSGTPIWSGHGPERWVQYLAYLESDNNLITPILHNVTLSFNYWPGPPMQISPPDNSWTNNNKPLFEWQLNDKDSNSQQEFQVLIARDNSFGTIDFDSSEQKSETCSWVFASGTSYSTLPDGIWYWKVRTKDSDGDWGPYSSANKFKIDTIAPNSTLSKPLNNGIYRGLDSISGVSFDSESGVGLNRTEISIQNLNDHYYWTGLVWSSNEVWLNVSNLIVWEYDTTSISWNSSTRYQVKSRAIDHVTNIQVSIHSVIFSIDLEGPDSIINVPENNTWLNALNIISGTSVDTGGVGLENVEICIEQVDDNLFWDGKEWKSGEYWLLTTGTHQWSYNTSKITWSTGFQYIIRSRASDNVSNIKISKNWMTFMFDDSPPEDLSITINNHVKDTNSTSVILTVHAEDTDSGVYQMAFSSDGDKWDDWEPYTENKSYILPAGDGIKTVYFKVKDNVGNIADEVFDTIKLDTTKDNDSKPSGPDDEEPKKKEEGDSNWVIQGIILIIVIIVIILIFFLLLKRNKKEKFDSETKPPKEITQETSSPSEQKEPSQPLQPEVQEPFVEADQAQVPFQPEEPSTFLDYDTQEPMVQENIYTAPPEELTTVPTTPDYTTPDQSEQGEQRFEWTEEGVEEIEE